MYAPEKMCITDRAVYVTDREMCHGQKCVLSLTEVCVSLTELCVIIDRGVCVTDRDACYH